MPAPQGLERGSRLGKYEIHGLLSVGGMAELYLASLAGPGGFRKFVAIKRVLPSVAQNESFTKMFLDEARITASLSHAAIAQVFELTEDPETREPMLVMEFVAGQNVEQIVRRARSRKVPLPLGFVCRLAHEMLLGLHFAHGFVEPATGKSMLVVHRDINPRNVMVTYTGGTKIIDFGIAKARGRLDKTQIGFVKGTLSYMAPEQVTVKELDGRTDLFAASVLFYEILSGHRLFNEPSDVATMQRIVAGNVPRLAKADGSLPAELVDAVMKGLEREPGKRWRTGREYARAIDRAVPDTFDDEQMGELMGRLFADKIAITRGLLSATLEASPADLRLMTMMGEEEDPDRARAADPIADMTTSPGHPAPAALKASVNERTEMNLEPVAPDATLDQRPAPPPRRQPIQEQPTDPTTIPAQARRRTSEARLAGPRSRTDTPTAPKPLKEKSNLVAYVVLGLLAFGAVVLIVVFLSGTHEEPVSAPLGRPRSVRTPP